MNTDNKFLRYTSIVTVVTILLLMIPFVAMQFSSEVDWSLFDFFVAGFLLFGTGFTYVLLTTKTNNGAYKAGVAVGLFAGLFLIWANLAVGIIGSENNPVNLLYFGVIAIGIIGGFVSRFRPRGLSFTLFLMAAVIGLIAVGILIYIFSQNNDFTLIDTIRFLGAHGLFIALFLASGLLFRRVAKD